LAQYAFTGCLGSTYYCDAKFQLDTALKLAAEVPAEYVAKVAVAAREDGYMKDMPSLLLAFLTAKGQLELVKKAWPRVVDNAKMLRNYVQMLRSGVLGRKSMGTAPKKLVQRTLESWSDEQLFYASVGESPSIADIIRMTHPKPANKNRAALYAYLLDKDCEAADLPANVRAYHAFKNGISKEVPKVNFELLAGLENVGDDEWVAIAKGMSWTQTRIHLNMLKRKGVFKVKGMTQLIADRLCNPELIAKAKVFPYQLLMAYIMTQENPRIEDRVPDGIAKALKDAMEIAVRNVPVMPGIRARIGVDTSGSMSSPVTGYRGTASSQVLCLHVAALLAAVFLRKNPGTTILPFDTQLHKTRLDADDSIMTNAEKLMALGGGGTDCSIPLAYLNERKDEGDLVIYVSDLESWADRGYGRGTGISDEWAKYRARNPKAKLVCIDLQANGTTQAPDRVGDTLNVGGGFNDHVFDVINAFSQGYLGSDHWVSHIEAQVL
jgi:60 kDa SS-A/Ro ribonucleoprotein